MDKKIICLIVAPSAFLLDERVFMSLGILKVAAVLENKGYRVEMLDLSGVENYEEVASIHAARSDSVNFGITATTPQLPAAFKISHAIRKSNKNARIILGGPHVTLVSAACKNEQKKGIRGRAEKAMGILEKSFDVLIAGDGEDAIFIALGIKPPKLIDADDPKSGLFLDSSRISSLPYPSRHLLDIESYHYFIDGERSLSLIAQLGCPFECGFCGGRSSPSLRRVRMRPIDNIVDEMAMLYRSYNIKGFMLYDDEINVNPKMIELMRKIKETQNNLDTEWKLRGFVKSNLFNEEQACAMYEAGFRWILAGFESGSPVILRNMNKKATVDDNIQCIKIARKYGLKVKALMSLGHPGESEKTIDETYKWILEAKPDDFDVTIITTYPGSPYYDNAVPSENNSGVWTYVCPGTSDRLHSIEVDYSVIAEYYKGKPEGGYKSFVFTDNLTPDDLVSCRDKIEIGIRQKLRIPFNPSAKLISYERSMGQAVNNFPRSILKTS